MKDLGFSELRKANVKRSEDVFHSVNEWTPTDWACAMGGECGEALNYVKKLRRLDCADAPQDTPQKRTLLNRAIAKEIADLIIYADLLAARLEIDMGEAVRQKFNEVSDKQGSKIKL